MGSRIRVREISRPRVVATTRRRDDATRRAVSRARLSCASSRERCVTARHPRVAHRSRWRARDGDDDDKVNRGSRAIRSPTRARDARRRARATRDDVGSWTSVVVVVMDARERG